MALRSLACPLVLAAAVACGGRMEYTVDRTFLSPDGATRAVQYHAMGGGAAGVCTRGVAVLPASAPVPAGDALRPEPGAALFTVSCASEVALRWRAADTLEVAYSVDSVGVQVWQRAAVNGGRTHLAFVARGR
jgi:hypothetical protein